MTSRFAIACLVIAMACHQPAAKSPAPTPVRLHGPELAVRAGEPWRYGKLIDRHFVSVRDRTGKTTWRCEPASPKHAHRCDGTRKWFSGRGAYTVEVSVPRRVIASQTFEADGAELGFEVALSFTSDELYGPLRLVELHVMRLLPSIAGVSLEPAWKPAPDSMPFYRLVNRSSTTVHGIGIWGNCFGGIERRDGGRWRPFHRGGFCGTVAAGKPVRPGEEAISYEGHFIGGAKELAPGEYRYVLRYSTVPRQDRGYAHASDLHVLAVPFEVPST